MILIRFAIGTFGVALIGMAIALAPASDQNHRPASSVAALINR